MHSFVDFFFAEKMFLLLLIFSELKVDVHWLDGHVRFVDFHVCRSGS
jgi:hypothetical protein